MERITAIVDLQYGSTGKGLIAGYLAHRDAPDTVITAWAANAGHTYIDKHGRKYINTMLANGAIAPSVRRVMVGPGSLIDPGNLLREIESAADMMPGVRIVIHPNAAVITQQHRDLEHGPMTKIGSTKKGVGEAMIQRIRRDPENMNTAGSMLVGHPLGEYVVTLSEWAEAMSAAKIVQIEGAQGVSLSLYHGFYPYVTSRDVSTYQLLADAGVPYQHSVPIRVVGTLRTFPIRVANRYDAEGNEIGHSGPHYHDQREMLWSELGIEPELTTVTRLPRRVFSFSWQQISDTIRISGATHLFMNFANYIKDAEQVDAMIGRLDGLGKAKVSWVGVGPSDHDVVPIGNWRGCGKRVCQ